VPEQVVGPTSELPSTSASPPVSETAAHDFAVVPSPKLTPLIWSGWNVSQLGMLNE
jgi:hypothetical protein